MASNKIFIHAVNVHQGGGRVLLDALLPALAVYANVVLTLDARMPIPQDVISGNIAIRRVRPSLFARWAAERWLMEQVGPEDKVLCFGNLPPLFRLRGWVAVFVQNRYLIEDADLSAFPVKVRWRIAVERMWFSRRLANADQCIVQTPTMKRLLNVRVGRRMPIRIIPFAAMLSGYARAGASVQSRVRSGESFLYVASGEPHKNHRNLVEAWCILSQEGICPLLTLTLHPVAHSDLLNWIEEKALHYPIRVVNAGALEREQLNNLYLRASAFIYPSKLESLGLPLIEARQAGLPVLASELDYVRDVLDPEQSFNPDSAASIARAVKRHLKLAESSLPLHDAQGFLQQVFSN